MTGGEITTTRDTFLGGRLTVRQPAEGYRAGGDPIFLAAALSALPGQRVLDLGCGVGTAALCLLARLPEVAVTGLELQPELARLARANAIDNGFGDRLTVVEGSLLAPPESLVGQVFDHVMTNPPWLEPSANRRPRAASKGTGHIEGDDAGLAVWLKRSVRFLRRKGTLAIIHRADRLADLLAALAPLPMGEVRILPLWPRRDEAAIRVVVTARREVRTPTALRPGLVLHEDDGSFTTAAEAVMRNANALP